SSAVLNSTAPSRSSVPLAWRAPRGAACCEWQDPKRHRPGSPDPPITRARMTAVTDLIQHRLLPRVSKPNRYLGNALHVPRKPLELAAVRVLLAFPDAYEIGLSNVGIRIIHHILNQRPDTAAELVFAPWPDAEAEMRRLALPLFSLESHAPASEFDLLGFSLQYELQYTNVLMMLELAGLPLRSVDRDGRHPLV